MDSNNETIRITEVENQRGDDVLIFPEDAVYEPNLPENKREGKVEVYKDGLCIAVLLYKNNKLNGLCKFYENAKLVKQITFVNGKMEGLSIEGNKQYLYKDNKREFELISHKCLEGYVYEKDLQTGKINRCYRMNVNQKPDGIAYIFQDEDISSVVYIRGENEMIVLKEFKDGKMIERDESGNVIYEGEFLRDNYLKFPRHGNGKEIRGEEMYIGNWICNQKKEGRLIVKGHLRYEGMWMNDIAHGRGCLYDNDKVICKGEWQNGVCEKGGKEYYYRKVNWRLSKSIVMIMSYILLVLLVICGLLFLFPPRLFIWRYTKEITFKEGYKNDWKGDLVIKNYPNLQSIIVKKNSLQNLNSLKIRKCKKLKTIIIEDSSFENVKNVIIESI